MKDKILKAGIKAWLKDPASVTASNIGRMCKTSHALVLYHFPYGVKDAVAEYAVQIKQPVIISQLIVLQHDAVKDMSPSEKLNYLKAIL